MLGIVVIVCGNQKIPLFEPLLYLSPGSGVRKPTLRGVSSATTAGESLRGCSASAATTDKSSSAIIADVCIDRIGRRRLRVPWYRVPYSNICMTLD